MRFSIIIPVYNASRYIGECLESILAQPYTDYEVIAVNDGSRDDSSGILHRYAARDPRIHVIDTPNGGVSAARNTALDAATGEWIVCIDADDLFTPDALGIFDTLIGTHPRADMICCSSITFGEGAERDYCVLDEAHTDDVVACIRHYATWGYALRRDIIERHAMRFHTDLAHSEDRVFIFEYATYARSIVTSPQVVIRYRRSEGQATRTGNGLRIADHELRAASYVHAIAEANAGSRHHHPLLRHRDDMVRMALYHFYTRRVTPGDIRRLRAIIGALPFKTISTSQHIIYAIRTYTASRLKRLFRR